jgi:hypothetical protein
MTDKAYTQRTRSPKFGMFNEMISLCLQKQDQQEFNQFSKVSNLQTIFPNITGKTQSNVNKKLMQLYELMETDLNSGRGCIYLKFFPSKKFPNITVGQIRNIHANFPFLKKPEVVKKYIKPKDETPKIQTALIDQTVRSIKPENNNGRRDFAKYESHVAGELLQYCNTKLQRIQSLNFKGTDSISAPYPVYFPNLTDLQLCMVKAIWENSDYNLIDQHFCVDFGGTKSGSTFTKSYGEAFAKSFEGLDVRRLRSTKDPQMNVEDIFPEDKSLELFLLRMKVERALKETDSQSLTKAVWEAQTEHVKSDYTTDEERDLHNGNDDNNCDDMLYVSWLSVSCLKVLFFWSLCRTSNYRLRFITLITHRMWVADIQLIYH